MHGDLHGGESYPLTRLQEDMHEGHLHQNSRMSDDAAFERRIRPAAAPARGPSRSATANPYPRLCGEAPDRQATFARRHEHGETLDPQERSFYPMVEFRDAACWFARQGYLVVVPIRPGFGSAAIDLPDQGVFSTYFGAVGKCTDADFRPAGLSIARLDQWVIDYIVDQKLAAAFGAIVVGQSGGGWGALALSSLKSSRRSGHHHLRGRPRGAGRRKAQQQLRSG